MSADIKRDAVEAVAECLRGQCVLDIDGALDQLGLDPALRDDRDFLSMLDNEVFCCADCGWWCEISEMADPEGRPHDTVCDDCADDSE